MIGEWLLTKDDKIIEVTRETETAYIGREICYKAYAPLRYGNELTVAKSDIIWDNQGA